MFKAKAKLTLQETMPPVIDTTKASIASPKARKMVDKKDIEIFPNFYMLFDIKNNDEQYFDNRPDEMILTNNPE
jgi:hypothetical protein